MNHYTVTWQKRPQGVEQIHDIIGCHMVDGACVTHQRVVDIPRQGCPYADNIMHEAEHQLTH